MAKRYGLAVLAAGVCTGICFLLFPRLESANLVMVYLLGTLVVALRGDRGAAGVSAGLGVLCFDFFFVPPRFTFRVSDMQYLVTFGVMFVVAMIISHLTVRLREEADAAREQEQRSTWLLEKAKKAEIEAEGERLRSSLLSSVSHDFRTPLAAIVGSAGALLAKEEFRKNAAAGELLENIQTEGERLSRLVQNLLETTRLESGALQVRKEPVPLEEVVGSALERLEKSLAEHDVAIDLPADLPLVPMDALLVEQAFVNLLENAVRYAPAGSRIDISARADGSVATVTIADQGSGIQPDDVERVFEKFYHDPASPGAGLGLAICRAIVRAHGGEIQAENKKGGGALFRFTLPLTTGAYHG